MAQETSKESLYRKLNEVKTNHDKALNVYGTQTMNEVLEIVDSYFENLPVTTDKLSVEKLQEELESCIQTLISVSILANGDENIVIGNFVDSRLSKLAKTHENVTKYIERVTGKNIDVVLAENAALDAEEEE